MNQPVLDDPIRFSAPVTPKSPELQQLFDIVALDAAKRDRERIHPFDVVELIRRSRLGALRIPADQGGVGSSFRELFEVVIRLGEADSNVAHILRNHFAFVERFVVNQRDTKHQKWRQAVLEGAIFGLALTELDRKRVGGDVDFSTTLTSEAGGYRLNGVKYYSTGSLYADYVLIRAQGPEGIAASAIIPVGREGLTLVDDWDGMGQRMTGTGTTRLDNVRVEADEVVFDAAASAFGLPYSSTVAQLFLTAVNAGILRAVLRDAVALIHGRTRNFYYAPAERPAEDPILQQTIGQIASNAFAAEASVLAAADALDHSFAAFVAGASEAVVATQAAVPAAKAKVVVDDLTIRSASLLFDVGGASAATERHNLDRHWRNARTLASHNPASYKARAVGEFQLNGTPPPARGFF